MLPESIKAAYQDCFPEDSNGTSLSNWGEFESNNPSTFQSMYQFWAYKPLQEDSRRQTKTKATNDKTTYCYQRTETNDFSGLRRADYSEAFIIMASSSTSLIDLSNN